MAEDKLPHQLSLAERKKLTMTGVREVISFDDTGVVLDTTLGNLIIQGQGLQLKTLSEEDGRMAVEGNISALLYEEPRQGGWLRRLLG